MTDLDEWRYESRRLTETTRLTTNMAVRNSHGTSTADTDMTLAEELGDR